MNVPAEFQYPRGFLNQISCGRVMEPFLDGRQLSFSEAFTKWGLAVVPRRTLIKGEHQVISAVALNR